MQSTWFEITKGYGAAMTPHFPWEQRQFRHQGADANRNIQPAQKYLNLHLPEWFCIDIFSSWPRSLFPRAPLMSNNFVSISGALLISFVLLEAQHHLTWAGFANTTHSQHRNPCAQRNKPCWILADSMDICVMVPAIRRNTTKEIL